MDKKGIVSIQPPHQWMLSYTSQSEWIEKRGILLWIAFYTGGLGGGLYLVSLYFNSIWGMFIGWGIVSVIKGGTHLLFLGQPTRFWRIMTHPQSSWLARGFLFVIGFGGVGGLQLLMHFWAPGSWMEITLKVIAGVLAFCVATYTGFVLKAVKGVPFWNSWLLPVLFVMCGILGGFGLAVAISLAGGGIVLSQAEVGSRILLAINILLIVIYLWMASKREEVGKQSVVEQIHGHSSGMFWGGVVIMGIIIPAAVSITGLVAGELNSWVLSAGVVCEIIGGLSLRYCVLKSGAYQPLVAKGQEQQVVKTQSPV
jgi:sulfite dehydrogenase (quinone) subunit SoeC